MPSIMRKNVAAGTANDLNGLKFEEVPSPGALVTLYASTAAAGGLVSFSVGTEDFLVDAAVNIEASADVVDTDRDMVLDREPVPPGKMFLETSAQIVNYLLVIEDLPS